MRGIKETQKLKLGYAPVGIPHFFFNNYRLVSVDPKFLLLHMMFVILRMSFYFSLLAVWIKYQDLKFLNVRESSHSYTIIRLLIDIHLYLLEQFVICSSDSLISFRAHRWLYFIEIVELSCFTYIILRVFRTTWQFSMVIKLVLEW